MLLENFDKVEAIKAEEQNETILKVTIIKSVLQNVQDVLRSRLGSDGVLVIFGQVPFNPICINIWRVKTLLLLRLPTMFRQLKKLKKKIIEHSQISMDIGLINLHFEPE